MLRENSSCLPPPSKLSRVSSASFYPTVSTHNCSIIDSTSCSSCTTTVERCLLPDKPRHNWAEIRDSISSDASSFRSETFMDGKLWSWLPDDLIDRILAYLPVASFFRLRTVCKRWRFLAFSKSFSDMRAQAHETLAYSTCFLKIARCGCREVASYEPLLNKWYRFPINFLPSQVSVPVAAAKGLLCFMAPQRQYLEDYGILLVCNPLTRCWRVLPPMTRRRYPSIVAMIVNRKTKTYKLIVAGNRKSSSNKRLTEIYDSATCSWRLCGSIPEEEEISQSCVVSNSSLFCLSRGPQSGLLTFNVQQGVWMKLRTGRLPGKSKFRHLVESKGRIMIVGKALRRRVLGFYVWYLDSSTMRWREAGKMPQAICEEFFKSNSECFFCAAQGDFILICKKCNRGLIYNVPKNTWEWMYGCPEIFNPLLLAFDPGLDAVY